MCQEALTTESNKTDAVPKHKKLVVKTNNKSDKHKRIVKSANSPEINEEAPDEGVGWEGEQSYTGRAGKEATTLQVEPAGPEEDSHAKNRETVHEANKVPEVGK